MALEPDEPMYRLSFSLNDGKEVSGVYGLSEIMTRLAGYWQDERAMKKGSIVSLERLEDVNES